MQKLWNLAPLREQSRSRQKREKIETEGSGGERCSTYTIVCVRFRGIKREC